MNSNKKEIIKNMPTKDELEKYATIQKEKLKEYRRKKLKKYNVTVTTIDPATITRINKRAAAEIKRQQRIYIEGLSLAEKTYSD